MFIQTLNYEQLSSDYKSHMMVMITFLYVMALSIFLQLGIRISMSQEKEPLGTGKQRLGYQFTQEKEPLETVK